MAKQISIRQFLKNYDAGMYNSPDRKTQISVGWYDWFCKDTSLANKTHKLVKKLKQIVDSKLIDQDKHYVFFKNNCPMQGKLYDDFRICSIETGEVIYTVIPESGFESDRLVEFIDKGAAQVYEVSKHKTVVHGTWKDVVAFFKG